MSHLPQIQGCCVCFFHHSHWSFSGVWTVIHESSLLSLQLVFISSETHWGWIVSRWGRNVITALCLTTSMFRSTVRKKISICVCYVMPPGVNCEVCVRWELRCLLISPTICRTCITMKWGCSDVTCVLGCIVQILYESTNLSPPAKCLLPCQLFPP